MACRKLFLRHLVHCVAVFDCVLCMLSGVVIEKVVQEGSRMRLRCPLSRSFLSNTTVHWYRNNVLIITRPAGSDDVKPLYYYEEIFPDLRDNR